MDWKAHFIIGTLIVLLTSSFILKFDILQTIGLSLFAGMASLIPDLDHELSKGKKIADLIAVFLSAAIAFLSSSVLLFFAILGFYFLAFKIFKPRHRGITHTLVSCLAFSALVFVFAGFNFAVIGMIGYLSHLVADKELKLI